MRGISRKKGVRTSLEKLVSRIFRAGPKSKNRALLHKDFRKPKSVVRINKDTNLENDILRLWKEVCPEYKS